MKKEECKRVWGRKLERKKKFFKIKKSVYFLYNSASAIRRQRKVILLILQLLLHQYAQIKFINSGKLVVKYYNEMKPNVDTLLCATQ